MSFETPKPPESATGLKQDLDALTAKIKSVKDKLESGVVMSEGDMEAVRQFVDSMKERIPVIESEDEGYRDDFEDNEEPDDK